MKCSTNMLCVIYKAVDSNETCYWDCIKRDNLITKTYKSYMVIVMVMDMPNFTNVSCKWFEMGIVLLKLYIVLNLM